LPNITILLQYYYKNIAKYYCNEFAVDIYCSDIYTILLTYYSKFVMLLQDYYNVTCYVGWLILQQYFKVMIIWIAFAYMPISMLYIDLVLLYYILLYTMTTLHISLIKVSILYLLCTHFSFLYFIF